MAYARRDDGVNIPTNYVSIHRCPFLNDWGARRLARLLPLQRASAPELSMCTSSLELTVLDVLRS